MRLFVTGEAKGGRKEKLLPWSVFASRTHYFTDMPAFQISATPYFTGSLCPMVPISMKSESLGLEASFEPLGPLEDSQEPSRSHQGMP